MLFPESEIGIGFPIIGVWEAHCKTMRWRQYDGRQHREDIVGRRMGWWWWQLKLYPLLFLNACLDFLFTICYFQFFIFSSRAFLPSQTVCQHSTPLQPYRPCLNQAIHPIHTPSTDSTTTLLQFLSTNGSKSLRYSSLPHPTPSKDDGDGDGYGSHSLHNISYPLYYTCAASICVCLSRKKCYNKLRGLNLLLLLGWVVAANRGSSF